MLPCKFTFFFDQEEERKNLVLVGVSRDQYSYPILG